MVSVVGERLEGSRLGPHTIVVLRRGGDLENELFARPVIGAPAGDEQGRRAGALADPTLDLETAGEDVAGDGLGGVLGIFLYGARELVFGVVEERKEVGDSVEAVGDVGVGGVLDQFAERLVGTVEDCRQQQAAARADGRGQFDAVGGRGFSGEDVIRDRAEGEDVEVLAEAVARDKHVGRHVGRGRVVYEHAHV